MCKFCPFISNISVNVSVLTLVFISIDRYKGIMSPLSHRPRKIHTKLTIISIWLVALLCALPQALFYSYHIVSDKGKDVPFCSVQGGYVKMQIFYFYNIFLVILEYILPLFVMSFTYIRISLCLWKAVTPGVGVTAQDLVILKNKKRAIIMLVTVVIIFCLCWLPYQTYFIIYIVR